MKNFYFALKKNSIFLFSILFFSACKKEETIMCVSPNIEILSAIATSLGTCEVVVFIDKGKGHEIKYAELFFEDITITSSSNQFIEEINLTGDNQQTDTIIIETGKLSHDYIVKASIKTEEKIYYSENKTIRSPKSLFFINVFLDDRATNEDFENNYMAINKGGYFALMVKYTNHGFRTDNFIVKLNKEILVDCDYSFDGVHSTMGEDGEIYAVLLSRIFVPHDINPGIYDVYVYIDGFEFMSENQVRILEGEWTIYDDTYPGEIRGEYSHFLIKEKLYLIGGEHHYSSSLSNLPVFVWEFDLNNKKWFQKKDFSFPRKENYEYKVYKNNFVYNNKAYVIMRSMHWGMFDINNTIWEYNPDKDDWQLITEYPGTGEYELLSFIIDGKIYVGGGYDLENGWHNYKDDLWYYDLNSKSWNFLNDLPANVSQCYSMPCISGNNAYIHHCWANTFWEYNSVTNAWTKKGNFPDSRRYYVKYVALNNHIYLLGGTEIDSNNAIKDCWVYSIESDSWKRNASYIGSDWEGGIAFCYNNKLIAGLGFTNTLYKLILE